MTYDWNYVEGESLMQEDIYSMSNLTLTLSRNIIGQIINHIYICNVKKKNRVFSIMVLDLAFSFIHDILFEGFLETGRSVKNPKTM